MRGKKHNPLSRRRTRRPDGGITRDLRRLSGRRRGGVRLTGVLAIGVLIFYLIYRLVS